MHFTEWVILILKNSRTNCTASTHTADDGTDTRVRPAVRGGLFSHLFAARVWHCCRFEFGENAITGGFPLSTLRPQVPSPTSHLPPPMTVVPRAAFKLAALHPLTHLFLFFAYATGYVRDEARFARYGSLEIKTESVEDLLQKCEAEIHELYDDVQRFQADFVDMSEGFKRRIKLLHMKLKRLRAGYVNVAKRRVADAKAMLRSKPPQLGGIPAVQDALQRCEGCVSAMSTILEMTTIDLLSEDSFNNQMRAIIMRLDSKQHDLDAADRDLSVAVDKAMDAIGGLVEKVAAARQSQAAAAEAVAQVAALAEPSKQSSFDPESPWVERWDGQGNTYYENIKTGLTQWERPPGFGAVPPSGASQDTNSTTQAQPHKPTHKQTDSLDVLCSGEQLREDDSIASILQEAQRYAHVGQGAMSKVKPVDDLVLGDNSVVKVRT